MQANKQIENTHILIIIWRHENDMANDSLKEEGRGGWVRGEGLWEHSHNSLVCCCYELFKPGFEATEYDKRCVNTKYRLSL